MELRTARVLHLAPIVICGLVPLLGLVFFDWSLATVIFMLWLDAYLASLRMIPANVYLFSKDLQRDPLDPANPVIDRICRVGFGTVMWMFLALPVMIAGKYLDGLVSQLQPGGFRVEAYDLIFDRPWWFAVLVGGRLYQCMREFAVARAAGPSRFAEMIKALYGFLLCKGVALFALAGVSTWFGFFGSRGPEVFVGMTLVGLIAVEWYVDRWFHPTPRLDAVSPTKKQLEIVHGFDTRRP